MYKKIAEFEKEWPQEMQLTQKVMDVLTDESLSQSIVPERRTLGRLAWHLVTSLRFAVMHQVHHRGQMTVLMRQAGLRIPEVYGPTYESWLERGMAPLA